MHRTVKYVITAITFAIGTMATSAKADLILLSDDFSGGTVSTTFRAYENQIDTGWRKAIGYGSVVESAWTIAGGVVENSSTVTGGGYPTTQPSETPLINFFSGGGSTETLLRLKFDYSISSGDRLWAHLWGYTGTSDFDGQFVSNIEAAANGNVNNAEGGSDELDAFNLKDGTTSGFGPASTAISGELTGSGTFDLTFRLADLGISGVTTAADLDYYLIQFAKDEDGTAGTTSIDNLSFIASVPEPSSAGMVGLLCVGVGFRRRRRSAIDPFVVRNAN